MTTFRQLMDAKERVPERHVVLKRNAFNHDWQYIPNEDLALGLRRISSRDIDVAKAEAAKYAIELHQDREGQIEAYNETFMCWAIIFGTCDANDFALSAAPFEGSEENVRNALTKESIRYVWDHIDAYHVETGPFVRAATDDEVVELANRLLAGPMPELMGKSSLLRVRKLLHFVRREIEMAEKTTEDLNDVFIEMVEGVSSQLDTNEAVDG